MQAFLDFVINGESKPLGEITHYVQKAEWQGRLSEHVHFLFWTKGGIPPLHVCENGNLNRSQDHITHKAEALASAKIHFYPYTSLKTVDSGEFSDTEYITQPQDLDSYAIYSTDNEMKVLSKNDIFKSITQEPMSFQGNFLGGKVRNSLNNLVRSVNQHICSAYCKKTVHQHAKVGFRSRTGKIQ